MLNTASSAAFGELLLGQESTDDGEEDQQQSFQDAAVSGILHGNGFLRQLEAPVDTVDTAGDELKQDTDILIQHRHIIMKQMWDRLLRIVEFQEKSFS